MAYQSPLKLTGAAIIWHCDTSQGGTPDNWLSPHHSISSIIKTLYDNGYSTTAFAHEYQIVQRVTTQRPDLLLIHLQASGNRGYDLCKRLRAQASTRYLPIVFVGARAEISERMEVLRCGGNAYLQLPISAEECWLTLQQHLKTARLVSRLQADRANLMQRIGEYSQILDDQTQLKLSLARENQALQKLAFIDSLTQVANRQSFDQTMTRRWQEAYENHQPLSLLMCDIDYFKRYNDAYGHVAGDCCLRAVADALVRGTHRERDQVARYGGEEFAIILPNTRESGARRVALSVQSEVARAQIPHKGSPIKENISLSIGLFTLIPESAHQPYEVLVQKADEALYAAKLWGRDRSVVNTADGLSSVPDNYCLYDYTQTGSPLPSLSGFFSTPAEQHPPTAINQVMDQAG